MLRLSNTSIRLRLALILALPVLGMLLFAGVVVVQQARTVAAMETLQGMTRMAARASALVHTLQKERGLSAGYLGSGGRRFGEALAEQRRHTDRRLQALRDFIAAADGETGIPERAMTALDGLAARRQAVDAVEVPVAQALAYYTGINDALLGAIARAPRLAEGAAMANRTTAFVNLLQAKERAGLERAVLANTFSADAFGSGMFERFVSLVAAQRAYLEGFHALADARTVALFEGTLEPAVTEPVARLRETARTGGDNGFGVDAGAWFDAATARIEALRTVEQGMVEGLTATAAALRADARRDLLFGAGGAGAAVLAAGLLAFLVLQRMTRRIAALQETIAAVERTSDLNLRAGLTGSDEVGRTARAFDRMMEKLRGVLHRVAHSSDEVAAAAEQLSAATEQSDQGARRQHQETEQVAAAVHEMASQVEEVVQRSGEAARAARQADEETRNGALTATESIGAIETLVGEVNHSTGTINRLADNSRQVEQVLEVIEGISERTNLLALNAAIEAARAGEHGRGFAVVAEEVRALAGKTQGSIQEIQETIERLRADAGDAVGDMERARRRAEEGVGQVEAAAESLAAITGEVATISELNEQIAHTIEQQGQVAGQVDASVQAIRRATEEGSEASRESAAAAGRLAELAAGLRTAVAEFRT